MNDFLTSSTSAAILLVSLLCSAPVSIYAEQPSAPPSITAAPTASSEAEFRPYSLLVEGKDVPTIAQALAQTFLSADEYKAEVEKVRQRFADFEKDTHGQGDISRYLNDRLVIHGLSAANGKVEKIQKGLIWLAMYKEFQQAPPEFIEKFAKDNKSSLLALFQDFKWERASDYIKNREWRAKKADEGENKKTASAE